MTFSYMSRNAACSFWLIVMFLFQPVPMECRASLQAEGGGKWGGDLSAVNDAESFFALVAIVYEMANAINPELKGTTCRCR